MTDAERHATEHIGAQMHPKFYESEVKPTSIKELEFVRSPFYDMAKYYHLKEGESSQKLITQIAQKFEMLEPIMQAHLGPGVNSETVAFKRAADKVEDPKL